MKVKILNTPTDLEDLRQAILRERKPETRIVKVCSTTGCRAGGAPEIFDTFKRELVDHDLQNNIEIKETGCQGFCEQGPVITIEPEGVFYTKIRPTDVPEIVSETLVLGKLVDRLLYTEPETNRKIRYKKDIPFFSKQVRNVSAKTGTIDPSHIDEYIAEGGYLALGKALSSMVPEEIIATMEASGLRGRGGGGFPVGRKWRSCREAPGMIKYVIANGDEGDPGAFMDQSLMEGDPHSILEGIIIGAYAIGAGQGFIYVRDEYPNAVARLQKAIEQAMDYGLLGENIIGSGFSFKIELNRGAGAFVCGESTALMNSLEGKIGEPRAKYIHTVESGLWENPSNLNNVETWANVPLIIEKGAEWYTKIGTPESPGTKIFSLVGKVRNTGLVEVPMGTTLREIVYDLGGGIRKDKELKAVQTGGPSGGCIPMNKIDIPVDYDSLNQVGAFMGSGGMIVMDESTCMVDVAKYFIHFLLFESCGKCIPCREGLLQMHDVLSGISRGEGTARDIDLLLELATFMSETCLCALGGSASNPVLSTIRYFRHEYEEHIRDKKCRAAVCRDLFEYYIDDSLCDGCTVCGIKCPEQAISGERKQTHVIDQEKCIVCGVCCSLCPRDAINVR